MSGRTDTNIAATCIEVVKSAGTRYHSRVHRNDGVTVALEGGSWNKIGGRPGRVPHDIAHLIVERELALARGLWGVLAAGGLVQNASLASGRRPPHAERRGREVTARSREQLRQAEVLVRAAADASLTGARNPGVLRGEIGERWWSPACTVEALGRIDAGLRQAARDWDTLAPGSALMLHWVPPSTN